ncbi:MAG: hypothetical protein V3V33_04540 [Candidatus Lokiarchaeia archaeon]
MNPDFDDGLDQIIEDSMLDPREEKEKYMLKSIESSWIDIMKESIVWTNSLEN